MERLTILDQLRGLCLAIIIVDHINLFPSLLEVVTGRGLLWVTAAEGFFFISGLLVGLIRARQAAREGWRAASRTILKRAGQLYVATVTLTLLYTALAYWLQNTGIETTKHGLGHFSSWLELVARTLSLVYSYSWSDFLPYYVVYLLLAPLALWLLRRGWTRWVVLAALVGWVLPWAWPDQSFFPAGLRWQAYFFMGLVGGFHFDRLRSWWRARPAETRRRINRWVLAGAGVGLAVSAVVTLWPLYLWGVYHPVPNVLRAIDGNEIYRILLQNNRTGLLRLPFFLVVFWAACLVFHRYQGFVRRWLNWLLEPLGRNSLYVYIMQGAVVFGIRLLDLLQNNLILATAVDVVAILGIWWLVKKRFLFRVVPR